MADQATWSEAHVRRLFWRAGFGATPAEAARFVHAGKDATIKWLLSSGSGTLRGAPPSVEGKPLDPTNEWGHDVLWWLDRMVRSDRPLVEKMTLFWHDHFATRDQDTPLMLRQNRMLRARSLGSFPALLRSVTRDDAMQLFLSLADSSKEAPNENFARELMELFTLGHGYSERDIREAARALTGFRARWSNRGFGGTYYDRSAHDARVKRIFGKRGRYDWQDVLELVCSHRSHAPFIVGKLWSYFTPMPLDRVTRKRLVERYRRSGLKIKPVVGAILAHPALYSDLERPDMVKSPVVFVAGALRLVGRGVDRGDWAWLLDNMGQALFRPPSVAGWEGGPAWLSTNTIRARFTAVNYLFDDGGPLAVANGAISSSLSPAEAVALARRSVGDQPTSAETNATLERMVVRFFADLKPDDWRRQQRADMCQRVLRHLLLSGPEAQLH